jgi:hypothetical protein
VRLASFLGSAARVSSHISVFDGLDGASDASNAVSVETIADSGCTSFEI